MVTLIYNISKPEQGGVGRYVYEVLKRMNEKIEFDKIDLCPSFGKNNFEKLLSIFWKRKDFLMKNANKFSEINHFLQVEAFYPINKRKTIVTFHNSPPFSIHNELSDIYRNYFAIVRSILFLRRYKDALDKANFIIANSEFTKEGVIESGFDEDKTKVISLGIGEKFRIIKSFEKRKNTIGYIGSFAIHKKVDKLLKDWRENFAELQNYNLYLHGSGGVQFQKLRRKYDNKFNINFLGYVKEEEILNVYNSFKAFVFPSELEWFGLPIVEAVACGNLVFIYKNAKITPEVKKYCVEIDSASEIPSALEEIKESDLIKKSWGVKKEFSWDRNVKDTIKIYESV